MAHAHGHHHHGHEHAHAQTEGNISFAFWLNTLFALVEFVGGLYTNSVAILSDSLHDLGDSLSLGLSWYFHRKSRQRRDSVFSYGYRRFSLLGACISGFVLLTGSVFIIRESVERLFAPEQPDARGMLVLAVIGVVFNGLALFRLKKGSSVSERVLALHFVEDVLGWVAVLIGSIVMMFADVPWLDPVLSLGIAVYVLYHVYGNLRSVFKILLQAIPEDVDETTIREKLRAVPGVCDVHDIHAWSMDGQYNIMTLHVVVLAGTPLTEVEKIKHEVRHELEHLNLHHATIEMETEGQPCPLTTH